MAIDFRFGPEIQELRLRVRAFMDTEVRPVEREVEAAGGERKEWRRAVVKLRERAQNEGFWLPHMPREWGGMGLGATAQATVSVEAAKTRIGPLVLNAQAPDEGNMQTLLHWGTEEQREKYLRPLCSGSVRSCFAMTEPEVAGSDPTLIRTEAIQSKEGWVLNGHKWFITGARSADFAIVIARTEDEPEVPQAANSAFIVDTETPGWEIVRDIETLTGGRHHNEVRLTDVRVPLSALLGRRGEGHLLGQARLGPARLAHCMHWISEAETALDMMVERSMNRYSFGSMLSEKQGIQWLIADSVLELYQSKLMVLHAAYRIEQGLPFKNEVSMAKYHVANTLWRVIDRSLQVHGALGYSTDTPLAGMLRSARWSRFADGPDEIHKMTIAKTAISAFASDGTTKAATGDLPF